MQFGLKVKLNTKISALFETLAIYLASIIVTRIYIKYKKFLYHNLFVILFSLVLERQAFLLDRCG